MQTCFEGLQMLRIKVAARHLCKDERGMKMISENERLKRSGREQTHPWNVWMELLARDKRIKRCQAEWQLMISLIIPNVCILGSFFMRWPCSRCPAEKRLNPRSKRVKANSYLRGCPISCTLPPDKWRFENNCSWCDLFVLVTRTRAPGGQTVLHSPPPFFWLIPVCT